MSLKMQKQNTKTKIRIGDFNQILKEEMLKDKHIKVAITLCLSVACLFAFGFIFKSINYAAINYKALERTLKQ